MDVACPRMAVGRVCIMGDAAFAAPFAQTSTGGWTSQASRLRFGATVSGVVNLVVDDVRLDNAAMP